LFCVADHAPFHHALLDNVIKQNSYHAPEAPEFLAGISGTGSGFIPAMTLSEAAISSRATTRRVLKFFSKHVGHTFASCRQAGGISPPQNGQSAFTIIRSIISYLSIQRLFKFIASSQPAKGNNGSLSPLEILPDLRNKILPWPSFQILILGCGQITDFVAPNSPLVTTFMTAQITSPMKAKKFSAAVLAN
jgi:hypothetical protein